MYFCFVLFCFSFDIGDDYVKWKCLSIWVLSFKYWESMVVEISYYIFIYYEGHVYV